MIEFEFNVRRVVKTLPFSLLMTTALVKPSLAACTSSPDNLTLNCSGPLSVGSGAPITVYDAAAAFQPVNGSNSYTPANPAFPAISNPNNPGYNPNPPDVTLNFDSTTSLNAINPATGAFADKGLISANFSNNENPAVNNVVLNNYGLLAFSTNQIATSRLELINADSQVNNFTVNNAGTLSVTQTFFSAFNPASLSVATSGSPATASAKYAGATLNDMAVMYSDDNTNEVAVNNLAGGKILATGNYATPFYGRADTTVVNSGAIANTSWSPADTIASGHWAFAAWGGADYNTAPNTNPDSAIVLRNPDGSVTVQDTSALTLTNNVGGTIKGDFLALDITPTVYAAAVGASSNPFPNPGSTTLLTLPTASSNAGPRDSNVENYGSIAGNFYLGSGTHVIDNAAGATLAGSVYVDQRPSQVVFSTPTAGSVAGTYLSAGGTDFNGDTCVSAGQNTTDAGCATTTKIQATVAGGQSLTLTNEGTLAGDIKIMDQATSVNSIALTGGGFTGNIVALNGLGSNSLSLFGVTNLASVQNFNSVNLNTSNVTVAGGVSLVPNSTLATTIAGAGGTAAAPNITNIGSIIGQLSLGGATTVLPTFAAIVHNGDVYQVASSVTGPGVPAIAVANQGGLVSLTADASKGSLLLDASVIGVNQIPGMSKAGTATLNNLLNYYGSNANVQALGAAVEGLTPSAAGAVAEQLRPSVNGGSIQMPTSINTLFANQISSRLGTSFYGAGSMTGVGPRDFVASSALVGKKPAAATNDEGVWMNVVGSTATRQSVDGISGYQADIAGFIAGLDRSVWPGARVGAAVGYATGWAKDSTPPGNSLKVQSVEGLVYGSLIKNQNFVTGAAGIASLNYQSNRNINFAGFADAATATRSGMLYSAQVDAGRYVPMSFGSLVPFASMAYAHIDQGAYSENSFAGAALNVASQKTDSLQSGLGLKAVVPFAMPGFADSAFEARAAWRHEFLNTAESVTAAFPGSGTAFQAVGPSPARDFADVGAALRFALPADGQTFEVSYNARLGAHYTEQSAMLRARFDFGDEQAGALPGGSARDPVAFFPVAMSKLASAIAGAGAPRVDGISQADASGAGAQSAGPPYLAQVADGVVQLPTIDVFATTPLSGSRVDVDKTPAGITTIDAAQIEREKSQNIVKSLAQQTPSITVQDVAGNPFTPDVIFRGFDASPVSGTQQGLAVYQNGVRINEAFGDTVNWDLIPTSAVRSMDVVTNNPAFGLNALGGAISLQMKDGFNSPGTTIDVMGGSYGRLQTSLQWGKQIGDYAAYIAIEGARDNGYRDFSGSQVRRFYGDLGYKNDGAEVHLNIGGADNFFGATAAAPAELLQRNLSNVYTTPQSSLNQVGYVNATVKLDVSPTWVLQGAAHYRSFYQTTVDGNSTDAQTCDADATLLCFNDGVSPANGRNGQQLANPFPATATLGETDRTHTQTTSVGTTLQATNTDQIMGHDNHLVMGGSFDYGISNFGATAELGSVLPNYQIAGAGIFLGPSGTPVSDGPVSLRTTNTNGGLYALDTFDVTKELSVSAGGRLNIANIRLEDQLGGALSGVNTYTRFNPMIGATYKITTDVTAYAGYSEANRAPTPLELGCADPNQPCIIASFLVADPPLKQVISRTLEAGLRGSHDFGAGTGKLGWKLGVFRTDNQDDIMNVPSPSLQGFGYFQNIGATRRQGLEAAVDFKAEKINVYASYAYVDATFQNALALASNSPFADVNGNIQVSAGNQIPMIPRHRFKLGADYSVTRDFKIGADLLYVGSQYFSGDSSNQFPKLPGYAVVNADASYQVMKNVQVYARVENLFNNAYNTFGTFFDTTEIPNFVNGGAAFTDPRSLSPGQPRSFYMGVKATF